MILIDTSAWIEFLRNPLSPYYVEVTKLLGIRSAICDPIRMEILAGARDEHHLHSLKRLLSRPKRIETISIDYENAAEIYRAGRKIGLTVRSHIDCLIAAVAIRIDAPVLHADHDFDMISKITNIKQHQLPI
jgi:predicted nucleic acid-binding protein